MSTQGPLPSPIRELDLTAEGYGKKCSRYLMLSPGGEMMCRDKNGRIVATTAEEMLMTGNYVGKLTYCLKVPCFAIVVVIATPN